ncbi:MAG TPA: tetratricopeptide repeat protein [Kofleriaceae bacterium]|nr:tetratricopeptide repeat protein [Kofleriaceae bacterium]
MGACLDDNALSAYVDGALGADEVARIDAHISECASCRRDLSAIAGTESVPTIRAHGSGSDTANDGARAPTDPAGEPIGRYVMMREHARGGMGVVAIAYDPELQRNVALKLLRPELSAELGADGHRRLREEARAMAKLDHENVVTVHDVGEHAGQIFVAMELVDGVNLRLWLAQERRSWREIVRVCVRAGRGLAAAHRAGMVHRDFKPDNVLCGPGDRVRVTDFGLARGQGVARLGDGTGLVGTPAYMAPEVWRHEPATARSDQWSFCVTLYEALYGARPFQGDGMDGLGAAIQRGQPTFPRSRVPASISCAIARGLAHDPAARYPSIEALLRELSAGVRQPRRALIAAGVLGVVALAGGAAVALRPAAEDQTCRIPPSLLDGAWSTARASELETAFAATGRKHAPATAHHVRELLDRYAESWLAARTDACTATRVRGDQSEAVLDARVRCLDRRRDELAALTTALAHAKAADVDNAVQAAIALPPVEACSATGIQSDVPPPGDPVRAAQIGALDKELATARASLLVKHVDDATTRARSIVERARPLGYTPLLSRATRLLADLTIYMTDAAAAQKVLDDALAAASAAHDDRGVAEVWIDIVNFAAMQQSDGNRALELVKPAQAALMRADSPKELAAELLHARGVAYAQLGKYEEAAHDFEQSLATKPGQRSNMSIGAALCNVELRLGRMKQAHERCRQVVSETEQLLGPEHPYLGFVLLDFGNVLMQERDPGARAMFERALGILRASVGERHVAYALTLNNLGMITARAGEYDTSRSYYEQAIAVFDAIHHPELYSPVSNLGNLERELGHTAASRKLWERARDLAKATTGEDSDRYARALYSLGTLESDDGHDDAAIALYERSLAIATKVYGAKSPQAAEPLDGLGFAYRAKGDCARALPYQRQSLAAYEEIYGAEHPHVAETLTSVGDCELTLGDRQALEHLERALAIHDKFPASPPFEPAATRWTLARALDKLAGDRTRAIELAKAARALYAKSPEPEAKRGIAAIDKWLAKRR